MKKIIILAVATLSTGIVLSSNLKKKEIVKPSLSIEAQKNISDKNVKLPSYDVIAQAD